jgi:hypothetical protein
MKSSIYHFKLAVTSQEVSAYFALRHAIFLEEQGLFQGSEVDDLDAIAYPIIALDTAQITQSWAWFASTNRSLGSGMAAG